MEFELARSSIEISLNKQNVSARYSLFSDDEWASLSESLNLCTRELQVMKGVFADQTERQIASHLNISYHTVHSYLIRIYRKLDVNSRCELLLEIFTEFRRQQS